MFKVSGLYISFIMVLLLFYKEDRNTRIKPTFCRTEDRKARIQTTFVAPKISQTRIRATFVTPKISQTRIRATCPTPKIRKTCIKTIPSSQEHCFHRAGFWKCVVLSNGISASNENPRAKLAKGPPKGGTREAQAKVCKGEGGFRSPKVSKSYVFW